MPVTISNSVEQTELLGSELAGTLAGGTCVALYGELGAGKTQFVRGMVKGLRGNPRAVSSPTFVLLNVYPTASLTIYHLDAYRTTTPADFEAIGFSELLTQGQIVVVEWAEKAVDLLPATRVDVMIRAISPDQREIDIQKRA